ncbi:MAG TPA: lactonase family protein [Gemmata sp.]|nr:lactonase family protein [Gemmata sp.]
MILSRIQAGLAAITLLGSAAVASAADDWVYFGTYTDKAGSKGIYRSKFDGTTGKLSAPELAAEAPSPSFLAISPNGKFLYAVAETDGKDGGGVLAYALNAKTGELTKLNQGTTGGSGPCHISIHPKGEYATIANYGGGSTAVIKLGSDGKLGERVGFVQHIGTSADKNRQEGPHAHCSFFDPKGKYILTVDLGIDRVKVFTLDPSSGLKEETEADIVTPPGTGPRHIAIAPDEKFAYVCGELNSTVNVIELGGSGGKNKVVQTLSSLTEPVKGNSTAECILHPSGKFVYVSNRGHNSIAVFKVGEDRKLTAVGHITGDIKIPRNFNIDPSGKWMLIASQEGEKVGVWELDEKTGLGKETGNTVEVSKPVCVKFVPVAK